MNLNRVAIISLFGLGLGTFANANPFLDTFYGPITKPAPATTHPEPYGWVYGKLAAPGKTPFDQAWSIPTIYRNDSNPVLQELALQGQLQLQYATGSEDFGTRDVPSSVSWGGTEVRRFRLGMKARLYENIKFHSLLDLYADFEPRVYKRISEAYFSYSPCDAFALSVGKTELKFDREQEYSSTEFPLFERTAVGNMLFGGELMGVWAKGKKIAGGWLYELGAYSNDRVDEFSKCEGGTMILAKVGYNYTSSTSLDNAEVKLQYLYNSDPGFAPTNSDPRSPLYENCFALSNEIAKDRFGLTTEFLWADGVEGRANVWAISAMPTYSFSDYLQFVGTVEFAGSPGDNGVILPARYEAISPNAGDKAGDAYFATYAGLNYYIYGHKLKLMTGVKYSTMDLGNNEGNFDAWTYMLGLRMAF